MTLDQLRILVAVVEREHMTEAAWVLNIASPRSTMLSPALQEDSGYLYVRDEREAEPSTAIGKHVFRCSSCRRYSGNTQAL